MRTRLSALVALVFLLNGTAASPRRTRADSSGVIQNQQRASPSLTDERGIVALDQALRDLSNPFTIMSVADRPGEEDAGTLTYYRRKLGARAISVYATRGEAEERALVSQSGEEVGVTRTREALESACVIGADVYFLNLPDMGFSKSADESLASWGGEEALSRIVRAIRLLRPDVIVVNLDADKADGQQQALRKLALEAFAAAADAKRFTDVGTVWQVRRIVQKSNEQVSGLCTNLMEYDYARGRSYAEIAQTALGRYVSRPAPAGQSLEKVYYRVLRSVLEEEARPAGSLLEGLTLPDNLLRSIRPPRVGELSLAEAITRRDGLADALTETLAEKQAEGSREQLYQRYGADFFRVVRFTETLERAVFLALGLEFQVSVSDRILNAGQKFVARLSLRNGSDRTLPLAFQVPDSFPSAKRAPSYKASETIYIPPSSVITREYEFQTPNDAPVTLPHNSVHLYERDYYPIGSAPPGCPIDQPFGNRFLAFADIGLEQTTASVPAFVCLDVAALVEISIEPPFAFIRDWDKPREVGFAVRLTNRTPGPLFGALWVVPLALAKEDYEPVHVSFVREDQEVTVDLRLRLPILKPPLAPDVLIEFRRVKPAPPDPLNSEKISIKIADLDVAEGLRVGYVSGFDSLLRVGLSQLGVECSELSDSEVRNGDLGRFDTIVIDSRACGAHPDLKSLSNRLLEYVKRGGNLVVFYQSPDDWNSTEPRLQLAPFPIAVSRQRITNEKAPVKILDADHPLMSRPNKITEKDFEGWVEERAVYLPKEWASEYTVLLESADPDEEPMRGGLLLVRYGEGTYIYTSYTWKRQLRAMNAGAHRMLANLVSLPRAIKGQAVK